MKSIFSSGTVNRLVAGCITVRLIAAPSIIRGEVAAFNGKQNAGVIFGNDSALLEDFNAKPQQKQSAAVPGAGKVLSKPKPDNSGLGSGIGKAAKSLFKDEPEDPGTASDVGKTAKAIHKATLQDTGIGKAAKGMKKPTLKETGIGGAAKFFHKQSPEGPETGMGNDRPGREPIDPGPMPPVEVPDVPREVPPNPEPPR